MTPSYPTRYLIYAPIESLYLSKIDWTSVDPLFWTNKSKAKIFTKNQMIRFLSHIHKHSLEESLNVHSWHIHEYRFDQADYKYGFQGFFDEYNKTPKIKL